MNDYDNLRNFDDESVGYHVFCVRDWFAGLVYLSIFFNISYLPSLISTADNDENVGQIKQCNFRRALDGACVDSAEK